MSETTQTKRRKFRLFTRPVFWGLVLIFTAVVLLLDGIGLTLGAGMSGWRIVGAVLLSAWLIGEVIQLKFTDMFFPLAFLFLVLEEPIGTALGFKDGDIIANWIPIVAAFLLTAGTKAIFRPRHVVNGEAVSGGRLGSQTLYFDAGDLSGAVVTDHVGPTEIYLTNCEAYAGNGVIRVRDNVGPVTFHLPAGWHVVTDISDNLGPIDIPPQSGIATHSVTLEIRDNVGPVKVVVDGAD